MRNTIFCTFLQRDAERQDFQIYPGHIGERIFNEISKEAWAKWIKKQTMLINEKKLDMTHHDDRQLLKKAMMTFLFERQDIYISGYQKIKK